MTHVLPGQIVAILGGLTIVTLGIFVLTVKPRRAATIWFGLFGIGWGGSYAMNTFMSVLLFDHELRTTTPENSWLWFIPQIPFYAVAIVGLVGMACVFPRRLGRDDRAAVMLAGVVALVVLVFESLAYFNAPTGTNGARTDGQPFRAIHSALASLRAPALIGFLFLLILRFRASTDLSFRRLTSLTAAALSIHVGVVAGYGRFANSPSGIFNADGTYLAAAWAGVGATLVAAAMWLASMRGPDRRIARNMAWLTLGSLLLGMVSFVVLGHTSVIGGIRVITAAILGYAIVKHQLLGIDVKVRWTISKSTVAAAFIAVFFVASEGAQLLFGRQNELVGLAAAGALVFAMSPLQRLADRLAVKAVPVSAEVPISNGKDDAFRSAVRLALRGGITRREEHDLALVADNLGLNAKRALELRDEVEQKGALP